MLNKVPFLSCFVENTPKTEEKFWPENDLGYLQELKLQKIGE